MITISFDISQIIYVFSFIFDFFSQIMYQVSKKSAIFAGQNKRNNLYIYYETNKFTKTTCLLGPQDA